MQVLVGRPGVLLLDTRGNDKGVEVPVLCVCRVWCTVCECRCM